MSRLCRYSLAFAWVLLEPKSEGLFKLYFPAGYNSPELFQIEARVGKGLPVAIRRNPEPGRQAVLWLATAVVMLIGAAGCAFIILAAVENPALHLSLWGGLFTGVVVIMVWSSIPRDRNFSKRWLRFWLATRERSDNRHVVRVGRKQKPPKIEFGNNAPPSVDSVRDAAELNVSWVPHGSPTDRRRE